MSGVRNKGTIWALIPVKDFGHAKSRLRTVLSDDECAGLALNMARDVAAAITGSEVVDGLSLLGSGPEIEKLADELHCEGMEEFYDVDLSCNLGLAARQLDTNGVATLVIIPGDLPTLRAEDVDQLITRTESDLGISAAGRDGGTNALVLSPPGALANSICYTLDARPGLTELRAGSIWASCEAEVVQNLVNIVRTAGELRQVTAGWRKEAESTPTSCS